MTLREPEDFAQSMAKVLTMKQWMQAKLDHGENATAVSMLRQMLGQLAKMQRELTILSSSDLEQLKYHLAEVNMEMGRQLTVAGDAKSRATAGRHFQRAQVIYRFFVLVFVSFVFACFENVIFVVVLCVVSIFFSIYLFCLVL
jgi:hypothetical protein